MIDYRGKRWSRTPGRTPGSPGTVIEHLNEDDDSGNGEERIDCRAVLKMK